MNNWITHNGGPCPVAAATLVDIKHRDGEVYEREAAGVEDWAHTSESFDIVAYRLHKPAPQHPPINVEAEFSADGGKWRRGRIRYRSDRHTVVEFAHTEKAYGPSVDLRSRDIPDAKDKAIDAMEYRFYSTNGSVEHRLGKVYEDISTGRIPGVRLEASND